MQKRNFNLTIDTTQFEETEVGLETTAGEVVERKKFAAGRKLSEKLLPKIDNLLKKNKVELQDLVGIKVNPGPGSFTGTRIGVTVANALAFSLSVPVNGKEMVTPVYSKSPILKNSKSQIRNPKQILNSKS